MLDPWEHKIPLVVSFDRKKFDMDSTEIRMLSPLNLVIASNHEEERRCPHGSAEQS